MISLKRFYDNASNAAVNICLFLMLCIYPLYMKTGYVGLSDAKYSFFVITGICTLVIMACTGFSKLFSPDGKRNANRIFACLCFFVVSVIISFSLTEYKNTALTGAKEWNMGLVTILILSAELYFTAMLWNPNVFIIYAAIFVSALTYVIAIFDRFSLYIIPLTVRNNSFISTLGNINWFMGYYCLMTGLGVCFFLLSDREKKKNRYLLFAYSVISFICGFLQGSESVFLFFAAMFLILLFMAGRGALSLKDYLILGINWCLCAQAVRILRMLFPDKYNYETTGLCAFITSNPITAVMAAALGIMLYFAATDGEEQKRSKTVIKLLWLCVALGAVSYVVISIIKTYTQLLPGITNSVFYWDSRFGSGRGGAIEAALLSVRHMNFRQLLFGAGPDCFEDFVYSIGPVREKLVEYWPGDRLVNSHCAMLTLFINGGISGVASYALLLWAFLKYCFYDALRGHLSGRQTSRAAVSMGFAVFCLFIHDWISFAHLLNMPFAALFAGMALSIAGKDEDVQNL